MFLNPKEYQHIIDLMRGTENPDPVLTSMTDFFLKSFGIRLYDCLTDGVSEGCRRLRHVVWDQEEQQSFFTSDETRYGRNEDRENRIKEEFSRLCRQENMHEDFWDPDTYFAVPETIADELRTGIQHKAADEIRRTLDSITPIKRYEFYFDTVHIFYGTDADIVSHEEDGLSRMVENRIFGIKKQFDEFSALTGGGVVFTSLQTLKEKFDGNLFYYFR